MNTDLHFSSNGIEWQTPRKLYDYYDREYNFSLDVACTRDNCLSTDGLYVNSGFNGLVDSWYDYCELYGLKPTCFMNPPYQRGQLAKWVRKSWEESERGVTTVCLLPARPDTRWFQDYCSHGEITYLAGRLKFYDPSATPKYNRHGDLILDPAPFPSCIVVFGPEVLPASVYWSGSRNKFN